MADTSDTTITHEDIGEDLRRIVITGRLDTPGTNEISPSLHELAAAPIRAVIVDLSAVQFAASIAIGQMIATAATRERNLECDDDPQDGIDRPDHSGVPVHA